MIKDIKSLEEQVRAVSLENRNRRYEIAGKCRLAGDGMAATAGKPVVLGAAALVGFCLGLRVKNKCHQCIVPVRSRGLMAKILLLGISYAVHTARHDR